MSEFRLHDFKHKIIDIENILISKQKLIETWLSSELSKQSLPFYCSVDLRNAKYKVAPVDTNLFPGGFNNLNLATIPDCTRAANDFFKSEYHEIRRILLIPENHTRNLFYLENITIIQQILMSAGYEVRLGSIDEMIMQTSNVTLPSGKQIKLEPVIRKDNHLMLLDFTPDLILLNHDLSGEVPDILHNLSTFIEPPISLGWSHRLKSNHFNHYDEVVAAFSKIIQLDPWLLSPYFSSCQQVDFLLRQGEDTVAELVRDILLKIQNKYDEYGIDQEPFVVVKADAGTYGMSVMMVRSADEIYKLNRKQRTRLSSIKGSQKVDKIIVQEGVYSTDMTGISQSTAEPVIYMIGKDIVGGFYRIHPERTASENLNAPGMYFKSFKYPLEDTMFYSCTVVARLALIAAAREKQNL